MRRPSWTSGWAEAWENRAFRVARLRGWPFRRVFSPVISLFATSRFTRGASRDLVPCNECCHSFTVVPNQFSKRPGERLDHHVLTVIDEQLANGEHSVGVARSPFIPDV